MKDPEDEAFEQLALKQGQWEHTSGNRKRQIMRQIGDTMQSFTAFIRSMKR